MRFFLICSLVPLMVETIAMIEAIPMIIPSIVKIERSLCDHIPLKANLMSSMF